MQINYCVLKSFANLLNIKLLNVIKVNNYMIEWLFQALNGFLMMMTQNGKLLYISDNAAEYLGHSMVSHEMISIVDSELL